MVTTIKEESKVGRNGGRVGLRERGKQMADRAKLRLFEAALGKAMGVLALSSEQNYARIAQLFRGQRKDEGGLLVANWVENFLRPGGPGAAQLKRVLTSIDPRVRQNYLARFITNIAFHELSTNYLPDGREYPTPACLVISPTMRCNLRCVGCYAGNYTTQDDLPADVLDRLLAEARDMGTRFFIIVGGEPLVYQPLFDMFKKYNDCVFQFYTSGHLINEQIAKRIVELGNVVPAVSIEGFKEFTDYRRGEGGFDRVMRAMDILRAARALFAFSVTVTRYNIDNVLSDDFVDLMIEKGAGYGWYFTYVPIGRTPDLDLMPTPAQRDQLRKGINRIRDTRGLLAGDFWNDGTLSEGCLSGGRRYLHINNKGDVEPCVFVHFAVDNIKEKPLKEALASDYFATIRKAAPFGSNLLRPCPIIDHPQVLRKVVAKYNAKPTHEGAETIITDLAGAMDEYSRGVKELYDPIWSEEYQWVAKLHGKPRYASPNDDSKIE